MVSIAVYSIARNEADFVERWARSTEDADYRLVVDTGSTDETVAKLLEHDIHTATIAIKPFRFDDARNAALALLPDDIDVVISLDMDEVLVEGWRPLLTDAWKGNRLRYGFVWSWSGDKPDLSFLSEKITGRHTHRWKHPVHEILVPTGEEIFSICDDVLVEHHADPTKSRGQYLPLLELAVKESPQDDRCAHYLGREYFFHGDYGRGISELTRHLALPSALWTPERAASMRYIAKCHQAQGNRDLAREWFLRATIEHTSRETLIDAAKFNLAENAFHATIDLCERALALQSTTDSYMAERYANQEGPYDLAAVAYHHVGLHEEALLMARQAVQYNDADQRLLANLMLMAPVGETTAGAIS